MSNAPPHTDWLQNQLQIGGPAACVASFRAAAAGAGIVPWHLDLDRFEEDWFHKLVSPPAPQRRSLSLEGARILAGELREAVARRHALAVARTGGSRACPFDLHALVPVPEPILRLGPDDPEALDWLWTHWGTTQELRHVTAQEDRRGGGAVQIEFWSADWTPWRALTAIAARWPDLHLHATPRYDLK